MARLPPAVEEAVAHAASEISRLDRLVADLLFAAGRAVGPKAMLDVAALVRGRAQALAQWATERRVAVETTGAGTAAIDSDAMSRAIDNILRNAIEASAPGGQVLARVRSEPDRVVIEVEDHAPACRPIARPSCSSPFLRPNRRDRTRSRDFEGHRARRRRPFGGHRDGNRHAFLAVDRHRVHDQEETEAVRDSKTEEQSRLSESAKVLIVEDEAGLRDGLASAVSTIGCQALKAAGIAEAQRLTDDSLDCVLLDIRLKDGDGSTFSNRCAKARTTTSPSS